MKKEVTLEEEVRLEEVLELTECQKSIKTWCEEDDIGICGLCEKAQVGFWDQVYLSKYVITENVENILRTNNGGDFRTILRELDGMGYNAEWRVCRASEVGAPHRRSRLYVMANRWASSRISCR